MRCTINRENIMYNNDQYVFESGKTYIAGKEFTEGLIEG